MNKSEKTFAVNYDDLEIIGMSKANSNINVDKLATDVLEAIKESEIFPSIFD